MWYLLQILVIGFILFLYQHQDLSHQPLGYVILFGYLTAYALTWIISRSIDALLILLRLIKHSLSPGRGTYRQKPGNIGRIHTIRSRRLP